MDMKNMNGKISGLILAGVCLLLALWGGGRPSGEEKARAKRWLIELKENDQPFKRYSNDSIANLALNFYDRYGDSREKALAYYYEGRVNADLGRMKEALVYFLQADSYAKETDDQDLIFRVLSRTGQLYIHQEMPYEAVATCRQAFDVARLAKDSANMAKGGLVLARAYRLVEDWRLADHYYARAARIAKRIQDYPTRVQCVQEILLVYANQGFLLPSKMLTMEDYLGDLAATLGYENDESAYLAIGNIYEYYGKTDSARAYLDRAMASADIYIRRVAYKELSDFWAKEGQYREAERLDQLYEACQDSIASYGGGMDLYLIKRDFEANQQTLAKKMDRYWTLLIAGILLVAIMALIRLARSYLEKRQANHRLAQSLDATRAQNRRLILEAREKEARAERSAMETRRNNRLFEERITTLESRLAQYERHKSKWEKGIVVLNELRENPRYASSEELDYLVSLVDETQRSFASRLKNEHPALTPNDIWYCCLIRLDFSRQAIARILCVNNESVNKQKYRLKKRLRVSLPKKKDLDEYLRGLWAVHPNFHQ